MAVNRQKIWQINFNKYNAGGGGLKCCHPLNYKNTTVNQSPPHVGERGNFLWIAQKHTRNTSCILSTVSAKSSYAMPLSTHGATGTGGGKEKYPLNTSQKKWRCFCVGNPKLIPYETIVRATSGEPEAVEEVLRHYSRRIRLAALENGHVNTDTEDSIKQRLITALFQFRFD